jgi:hypothetical protein
VVLAARVQAVAVHHRIEHQRVGTLRLAPPHWIDPIRSDEKQGKWVKEQRAFRRSV